MPRAHGGRSKATPKTTKMNGKWYKKGHALWYERAACFSSASTGNSTVVRFPSGSWSISPELPRCDAAGARDVDASLLDPGCCGPAVGRAAFMLYRDGAPLLRIVTVASGSNASLELLAARSEMGVRCCAELLNVVVDVPVPPLFEFGCKP